MKNTDTPANETPINAETIETWATNPENKDRAKNLGLRLFQYVKKPKELAQLESLGEFEDKATQWAIHNQMKARMLMMKLIKIFK
jgi:hypothetical protein